MMTTVSARESYNLMERVHGTEYCIQEEVNCNSFYLWRHIMRALVGIPIFLVGFLVPLRVWKRVALPLFLFALGLLILLLLGNIAGAWGTANSWINISFLPSIQPSEIAKIALIFYLGIWMDQKQRIIQTWGHGFLPFVVLMLPITLLIGLQPDFGSLMVIAFIAATMFFAAGGNLLHIITGGLTAILLALPIVFMHDYIMQRFIVFLDPSAASGAAAHQADQAALAIGSGGWFGLGMGAESSSGAHFGYLPEVESDMIFASMGEQFGFLRLSMIVAIFAIIAILGFEVAKRARNRFEMLVASGISAWILFQSFINMAVVIGLMPITGITLPFISYGGTSMIALLFASGVLLRIASFASADENRHYRRRVGRTHLSRTRRRV